MHQPTLDPSTRKPGPSPEHVAPGKMLVVDALVVAGLLGLLVAISYPLPFAGFVAGLLVVVGYRRLRSRRGGRGDPVDDRSAFDVETVTRVARVE